MGTLPDGRHSARLPHAAGAPGDQNAGETDYRADRQRPDPSNVIAKLSEKLEAAYPSQLLKTNVLKVGPPKRGADCPVAQQLLKTHHPISSTAGKHIRFPAPTHPLEQTAGWKTGRRPPTLPQTPSKSARQTVRKTYRGESELLLNTDSRATGLPASRKPVG